MNVLCYPLQTGELPVRNFDNIDNNCGALVWRIERKFKECECCGQVLPGHPLKSKRTKWVPAKGNTSMSLDEVSKRGLRGYLARIVGRLPAKYGNRGTLVVFFYAHDARDHYQSSLDKSQDWTIGVAYLPKRFVDSMGFGVVNGAPKRIVRKAA